MRRACTVKKLKVTVPQDVPQVVEVCINSYTGKFFDSKQFPETLIKSEKCDVIDVISYPTNYLEQNNININNHEKALIEQNTRSSNESFNKISENKRESRRMLDIVSPCIERVLTSSKTRSKLPKCVLHTLTNTWKQNKSWSRKKKRYKNMKISVIKPLTIAVDGVNDYKRNNTFDEPYSGILKGSNRVSSSNQITKKLTGTNSIIMKSKSLKIAKFECMSNQIKGLAFPRKRDICNNSDKLQDLKYISRRKCKKIVESGRIRNKQKNFVSDLAKGIKPLRDFSYFSDNKDIGSTNKASYNEDVVQSKIKNFSESNLNELAVVEPNLSTNFPNNLNIINDHTKPKLIEQNLTGLVSQNNNNCRVPDSCILFSGNDGSENMKMSKQINMTRDHNVTQQYSLRELRVNLCRISCSSVQILSKDSDCKNSSRPNTFKGVEKGDSDSIKDDPPLFNNITHSSMKNNDHLIKVPEQEGLNSSFTSSAEYFDLSTKLRIFKDAKNPSLFRTSLKKKKSISKLILSRKYNPDEDTFVYKVNSKICDNVVNPYQESTQFHSDTENDMHDEVKSLSINPFLTSDAQNGSNVVHLKKRVNGHIQSEVDTVPQTNLQVHLSRSLDKNYLSSHQQKDPVLRSANNELLQPILKDSNFSSSIDIVQKPSLVISKKEGNYIKPDEKISINVCNGNVNVAHISNISVTSVDSNDGVIGGIEDFNSKPINNSKLVEETNLQSGMLKSMTSLSEIIYSQSITANVEKSPVLANKDFVPLFTDITSMKLVENTKQSNLQECASLNSDTIFLPLENERIRIKSTERADVIKEGRNIESLLETTLHSKIDSRTLCNPVQENIFVSQNLCNSAAVTLKDSKEPAIGPSDGLIMQISSPSIDKDIHDPKQSFVLSKDNFAENICTEKDSFKEKAEVSPKSNISEPVKSILDEVILNVKLDPNIFRDLQTSNFTSNKSVEGGLHSEQYQTQNISNQILEVGLLREHEQISEKPTSNELVEANLQLNHKQTLNIVSNTVESNQLPVYQQTLNIISENLFEPDIQHDHNQKLNTSISKKGQEVQQTIGISKENVEANLKFGYHESLNIISKTANGDHQLGEKHSSNIISDELVVEAMMPNNEQNSQTNNQQTSYFVSEEPSEAVMLSDHHSTSKSLFIESVEEPVEADLLHDHYKISSKLLKEHLESEDLKALFISSKKQVVPNLQLEHQPYQNISKQTAVGLTELQPDHRQILSINSNKLVKSYVQDEDHLIANRPMFSGGQVDGDLQPEQQQKLKMMSNLLGETFMDQQSPNIIFPKLVNDRMVEHQQTSSIVTEDHVRSDLQLEKINALNVISENHMEVDLSLEQRKTFKNISIDKLDSMLNCQQTSNIVPDAPVEPDILPDLHQISKISSTVSLDSNMQREQLKSLFIKPILDELALADQLPENLEFSSTLKQPVEAKLQKGLKLKPLYPFVGPKSLHKRSKGLFKKDRQGKYPPKKNKIKKQNLSAKVKVKIPTVLSEVQVIVDKLTSQPDNIFYDISEFISADKRRPVVCLKRIDINKKMFGSNNSLRLLEKTALPSQSEVSNSTSEDAIESLVISSVVSLKETESDKNSQTALNAHSINIPQMTIGFAEETKLWHSLYSLSNNGMHLSSCNGIIIPNLTVSSEFALNNSLQNTFPGIDLSNCVINWRKFFPWMKLDMSNLAIYCTICKLNNHLCTLATTKDVHNVSSVLRMHAEVPNHIVMNLYSNSDLYHQICSFLKFFPFYLHTSKSLFESISKLTVQYPEATSKIQEMLINHIAVETEENILASIRGKKYSFIAESSRGLLILRYLSDSDKTYEHIMFSFYQMENRDPLLYLRQKKLILSDLVHCNVSSFLLDKDLPHYCKSLPSFDELLIWLSYSKCFIHYESYIKTFSKYYRKLPHLFASLSEAHLFNAPSIHNYELFTFIRKNFDILGNIGLEIQQIYGTFECAGLRHLSAQFSALNDSIETLSVIFQNMQQILLLNSSSSDPKCVKIYQGMQQFLNQKFKSACQSGDEHGLEALTIMIMFVLEWDKNIYSKVLENMASLLPLFCPNELFLLNYQMVNLIYTYLLPHYQYTKTEIKNSLRKFGNYLNKKERYTLVEMLEVFKSYPDIKSRFPICYNIYRLLSLLPCFPAHSKRSFFVGELLINFLKHKIAPEIFTPYCTIFVETEIK